MSGLDHAVLGFQQAIDSPRRHRLWRWLVRQRMAGVKDALAKVRTRGNDAWLASRERSLLRERSVLLERLTELGPRVLETPAIEDLDIELHRLLGDLQRYQQRTHDLVYDTVSLELGGSE
ncbi:MAG: hypothetical protein ACRDPI_03360 [Nocardioidaceae bacterium]